MFLKQTNAFRQYLEQEERSAGTVEKYVRDVTAMAAWLNGRAVTKQLVTQWKDTLLQNGYQPVTVNSMLASVNAYLRFLGREDCRVRALRLQRRLFRDRTRELSFREYRQLVDTAYRLGRERLGLLLETMAGTGIRVSEVKYITVEAACSNRAEISLKGKIRTVLLPGKLSKKLLKYAKKHKIASGEIFLTGSGKRLERKQIWAEMKRLSQQAGISGSKVFPHNLRHLFAEVFYRTHKNVVLLADVLGHSSIETTRLYLISSGTEHIRRMEQLHMIC